MVLLFFLLTVFDLSVDLSQLPVLIDILDLAVGLLFGLLDFAPLFLNLLRCGLVLLLVVVLHPLLFFIEIDALVLLSLLLVSFFDQLLGLFLDLFTGLGFSFRHFSAQAVFSLDHLLATTCSLFLLLLLQYFLFHHIPELALQSHLLLVSQIFQVVDDLLLKGITHFYIVVALFIDHSHNSIRNNLVEIQ